MLIEFTPEEQRQIEAIQTKYAPEREALGRELLEVASGDNPKRFKEITDRQQTIYDTMTAEIDAYSEKCQKERFKKVAAGGTEAILDDARTEAPDLIELLYNNTLQYWGKITKDDEEKDLTLYSFKGGKLYLKQAYALDMLKSELRFHIDALIEDQDNLQILFSVFNYAVDKSPYTDEERPTEEQLKARPYKRKPLKSLKNYGLMNDKAVTSLICEVGEDFFRQEINGQLWFKVDQTPAKGKSKTPAKKQILTYISLAYEGTEHLLTKRLTAFDKAVYDAIGTIFINQRNVAGDESFFITPFEVWRVMNGREIQDAGAKANEKQIQKICDSLDKMRFTRFYFDISEEIAFYKYQFSDDRIVNGIWDTYLINADKVSFDTEKGQHLRGYRINREPVLYLYNRVKGHILTIPYELLNTSDTVSDGENVAEFKTYLLQNISLMKRGAQDQTGKYFKRSPRILLSDIYEKTNIPTPEERVNDWKIADEKTRQSNLRKIRATDRQKIEGLLSSWVAKDWIKGYEPVKEKKAAIIGYDIKI